MIHKLVINEPVIAYSKKINFIVIYHEIENAAFEKMDIDTAKFL